MRPELVLRRRRRQGAEMLAVAREFVTGLSDMTVIQGAVVFGSVARGDFNAHSDIDVLIVAPEMPRHYWARLRALGDVPASVEAVVWTPVEWQAQLARGNPIAAEAVRDGVWLVGSPDAVTETRPV